MDEAPEKTKTLAGLIHSKIPKISAHMSGLGKASYNEQQKYHFRSIDDIFNALHKALQEHQCYIEP